ncbi:MAG: TolC family protein [Bacteroidetes bacterium]|nr:TolC family protein [Bacteroidota bacterium]
MKRIIYSLMALVLAGNTLYAQQGGGASAQLTQLIGKAMDNYPKLKEGQEYIKLGEARTELAYAGYMPVIGAEATYRYQQPTPKIVIPIPGFESSIQFIPANNYDFNIKLSQPVWDFGRTQASVNKAKSETATAKDNVEASKNNVAYQVAQLYYGIIFLNKSIDVQNEQVKLLEANEKLISDKIKNGDGLKFDLLSTQVKKNAATNRIVDLQTQLKKQYDVLNMLTANTGYDYITQRDADATTFSATTVTPDNNFDIKLLQDKLTSASWDIKAAKRGWLPSINLSAQAGYKNGFVPDINKLTFNYGVGVGLNVPIYGANRPNYQTKIAKINMQANTYALEAQKITLNKDIMLAQNDIAASEEKLKNYELQIKQADEALTLANARYKSGVITNLELLTSQTNQQDAMLGKIQLEYNLLLAKLELNRLGAVKFW